MTTSGTGRRMLGLGCGQPHGSAEILLKAALRAAEDQGADGRARPARRAPPAQRRRGNRRTGRWLVAVGPAGRVRRADREHPDHQPDGGRAAQAVHRPAARPERRRRDHRRAARAAQAGPGAGRPVPRRRAGAQAPGGRLPRGGRLADLAMEDAGAADHAYRHVLDARRRRRPGAVRGRRHAALGGPGHRGARPGRRAPGATSPASSGCPSTRRVTWARPGCARCATSTSWSCAARTSNAPPAARAASWPRTSR